MGRPMRQEGQIPNPRGNRHVEGVRAHAAATVLGEAWVLGLCIPAHGMARGVIGAAGLNDRGRLYDSGCGVVAGRGGLRRRAVWRMGGRAQGASTRRAVPVAPGNLAPPAPAL